MKCNKSAMDNLSQKGSLTFPVPVKQRLLYTEEDLEPLLAPVYALIDRMVSCIGASFRNAESLEHLPEQSISERRHLYKNILSLNKLEEGLVEIIGALPHLMYYTLLRRVAPGKVPVRDLLGFLPELALPEELQVIDLLILTELLRASDVDILFCLVKIIITKLLPVGICLNHGEDNMASPGLKLFEYVFFKFNFWMEKIIASNRLESSEALCLTVQCIIH